MLVALLLILAAFSAVTYGTWLIYHPAGFIVGGLSLFAIAVATARAASA